MCGEDDWVSPDEYNRDVQQHTEERIKESRRERGLGSVISGKIGDMLSGGTADRNGTNNED